MAKTKADESLAEAEKLWIEGQTQIGRAHV